MKKSGNPSPLTVARNSFTQVVGYLPRRARTANVITKNMGKRMFARDGEEAETKQTPSLGRSSSSHRAMLDGLRILPKTKHGYSLLLDTGVPPSEFAAEYELAYNNPPSTLPLVAAISWAPLLNTFAEGANLRKRILGYRSVEITDTKFAALCLRHLMDLQVDLHGLSGTPIDETEIAQIKKVVSELKHLQTVLKDREVILPVDEKPSLSLALTHFCLGAVSLTLSKLKEKCPAVFPEDLADGEHKIALSNPLHRSGMPKRIVVEDKITLATASGIGELSKSSVLEGIFQAASDYLAEHSCTSPLFQYIGWVNDLFKPLDDDPDRDEPLSLLELFIRHTEDLRETVKEPIEVPLTRFGAYFLAGGTVAVLMTFKAPNPFASGNIYNAINPPSIFNPWSSPGVGTAAVSTNLTLGDVKYYWAESFGFGSQLNNVITSVAIDPFDSSIAVTGYTYDLFGNYSLVTANFNASGYNEWTQVAGVGTLGRSLVITPDGRRLIIGPTMSGGIILSNIFIASYYRNGTEACMQILGDGVSLFGTNMQMVNDHRDGSQVLTIIRGAAVKESIFVRLFSNHSEPCSKVLSEIVQTGASTTRLMTIALASNNTIVEAGITGNDLLLTTSTSDGNLLRAQAFHLTSSIVLTTGLEIDSDGNRWIAGTAAGGNGFVIKMDAFNNLLNTHFLMVNGTSVTLSSLQITPNGSPLITGFALDSGGNSTGFLIQLNSTTGNAQWVKTIKVEGKQYRGTFMAPASDGTIVMAGTILKNLSTNNNFTSSLAQLSSEGIIPYSNNTFTQPLITAQFLSIYPVSVDITSTFVLSNWNYSLQRLSPASVSQPTPVWIDLLSIPFSSFNSSPPTNRRLLSKQLISKPNSMYLRYTADTRYKDSEVFLPVEHVLDASSFRRLSQPLIEEVAESSATTTFGFLLITCLMGLIMCCMRRRNHFNLGLFAKPESKGSTTSEKTLFKLIEEEVAIPVAAKP